MKLKIHTRIFPILAMMSWAISRICWVLKGICNHRCVWLIQLINWTGSSSAPALPQSPNDFDDFRCPLYPLDIISCFLELGNPFSDIIVSPILTLPSFVNKLHRQSSCPPPSRPLTRNFIDYLLTQARSRYCKGMDVDTARWLCLPK